MKLSFAYSPCPNDTFMFEAIVNNRIDTEGLKFAVHLADVEELNKSAIKGHHDITKLSFNAYTQLTPTYQLLNSGSALGRNCGPLLISKRNIPLQELHEACIGVPGYNTTAFFLLNFAYGKLSNTKELLFSDIEDAILNDYIDAGLIIHENRFTFENKGLIKIIDLGQYWEEKTGSPIPLGGIVCRRSFDEELKRKIDRVISRSVAYAISHPDESSAYVSSHAQEMDPSVMKSHIELYVNEYSKDIGTEGKSSIEYLFANHPNVETFTRPLFVVQDESFLSENYWTQRYHTDKTGWDVGFITPPLKDYVDRVSDKSIKILIPGAGNSHEAQYLHNNGFENVYVCDLSTSPLENIKKSCPTFPKDHLIHGDFFMLNDHFDLIIEQTFFCALHPSLRSKYAEKMSRLLNPNGTLVGLLFDTIFQKEGPPFGGTADEYKSIFKKHLDIKYMEACVTSIQPRLGTEVFFEARSKEKS